MKPDEHFQVFELVHSRIQYGGNRTKSLVLCSCILYMRCSFVVDVNVYAIKIRLQILSSGGGTSIGNLVLY